MYTQLRLAVTAAQGVMQNGAKVNFTVPSDVLKTDDPFNVTVGHLTSITLEIDLSRSIVHDKSLSLGRYGATTSRIEGSVVGRTPSSGASSCSLISSPGRSPENTISMSAPGRKPRDRMSELARSRILIGVPMSSM